MLLVAGGIAGRLALGPITVGGLSGRVAQALAGRLGPDWKVDVGGIALERTGLQPLLRVTEVEIRNPEGLRALRAPEATVAIDPWSLITGRFVPRSVSFRGLALRVALAPDGSLVFRAGAESDPLRAANLAEAGPGPEAGAATADTPDTHSLPAIAGRAAASAVDLLTATDGLFGALDQASIERAQLVLVGSDGADRFRFDNVSLGFERPKDSLRRFRFSLNGPVGRWGIEGTIGGRFGEMRTAAFHFRNVPVSDVMALSGMSDGFARTNMPLSGQLHVSVDAGGHLTQMDSEVEGLRAVVHLDDPDLPQFVLDEARLKTSFDTASNAVLVRDFFLRFDGYEVRAAGRVDAAETMPWRLQLATVETFVPPMAPQDQSFKLDRAVFEASGVPGGGVRIDRLDVAAGAANLQVSGTIGTEADRRGLSLRIEGHDIPARQAVALWPAFSARNVRDHLAQNLRGGTVRSLSVAVDMTETDLAEARARKPLADHTLKTQFSLLGADYVIGEDLPLVQNSTVSGTVTGRQTKVEFESATLPLPAGRSMTVPAATFTIPDSSLPRIPAVVNLRLTGTADALAGLLASRPIRSVVPLDINPSTVKGNVDLKVTLNLPVDKKLKPSEVQVIASGALSGLSVDGLFGKDRLDGGNLNLLLDRSNVSLKGEARLAGLPINLDFKQSLQPGATGEAVITAVLDDAARAKRGLPFGKQISGPVALRVAAPLSPGRTNDRMRIEADLTKVRIDDAVPGWSKPAGRPAKLSFAYEAADGGGHRLDDLVLDGGGLSARGSIDLGPDGAFNRGRFTSVKLSPADDMRLDVDRSGGAYRVAVKGALVDARPFLKALNGGGEGSKTGRTKDTSDQDVDLDLSASILAGFNDEAITGAVLKLSMRDGDTRQLQLNGRLGGAPVSVRLVSRDKGGAVVVQSDDAGALLRYADLYKRMSGGQMHLQFSPGSGRQVGNVVIRDFSLRNEPALRRIVSAQPSGAAGEPGERSGQPRIDTDDTPFTRLQAAFSRSTGRFDLSDGIIWGPQVGIKLDGSIDYARDRADLTGTFIPAYELNNVFGKIPVFGTILSGSPNEGVFAVSFRITGQASAPTLTINPLTAVAPGIFRKFLEAFTPDGSPRPPAAAYAPTAPDR